MSWLKIISQELIGLFVDDVRLALEILVWVSLLWLALPRSPSSASWHAPLLLFGLLAILLESVWRGARPHVRRF
jgi:hypothetical protein